MTNRTIQTGFRKYQKRSAKARATFLQAFEEKMLYRTTKTENPETTRGMVRRVLARPSPKA